jgi:hypothetical protein
MKHGWRRQLALLCVAAGAAVAILVPGGSAAARAVAFTFEAVPGPGEVTYKENIAYRAKISNTSGSTLTHVIFRMRKPFVGPSAQPVAEATFQESTCPQNNGQGAMVTNADGTVEWTCEFGNLPASSQDPETNPQTTLSVVWQVPELAQAEDCDGCLNAPARVTVKEGLNDQTNPNDAFMPSNTQTPATLLSTDTKNVNSKNYKSAGGYETKACTNPSGTASLQTKQALDVDNNKVSTKVCIATIPTSTTDLGLATTIREGVVHPGNPGNPKLETSDVCVAALGSNCGAFGEYTPQVFDADHPLTLVFQIPDALLDHGDKITKVWHNYDPIANTNLDPLPLCGATVPLNGCLDGPPTLSKGKDKTWTIILKTRTNGWSTWG